MKRSICLFMIIILTLIVASTAYSASSRRGKKVFNKVCKECHTKRGEGGKMSPSDKTMDGWSRFLKKNNHDGPKKILEGLSKKEMRNLKKFLLEYAIDADTTETCG